MVCFIRLDLRRVPCSSTLCNSSCIAAFLKYSCSCQTIQTSIPELLLVRSSFELMLVYSCPILSLAALSCATATVWPLVVVTVCGHTGKKTVLIVCGEALMAIVCTDFLKTKPVPHTCPGCHNHVTTKLTS